MLCILRHTQHSFSEEVQRRLGKGKVHAAKIYSHWCKKGEFPPLSVFEPQAHKLIEQILSFTDASLPREAGRNEEYATVKFLLAVEGGMQTESVLIPMDSGQTICLSSQIGCRMGCSFCETGRMGLLRHLKAEEIVAQVAHAKHILKAPVRNIVFMGMGEPLDNYEEMLLAVKVLTDPSGFGFGPSRITISTSGKVDALYRFIEDMDPAINLAVSVNAPSDPIRQKLMPVNRKWNMEALKKAMEAYCAHPRREILAEYVLIDGMNVSLEHADLLAEYLKGLKVRINLIPYNPQSNDRFQPPPTDIIEAFAKRLRDLGYQTLFRRTKGRQIMAACGQLGNLELKKKLLDQDR